MPKLGLVNEVLIRPGIMVMLWWTLVWTVIIGLLVKNVEVNVQEKFLAFDLGR